MKLSKAWQKFKYENAKQKKYHYVYPQLGRHMTMKESCSRITNLDGCKNAENRSFGRKGKGRFQHFL